MLFNQAALILTILLLLEMEVSPFSHVGYTHLSPLTSDTSNASDCNIRVNHPTAKAQPMPRIQDDTLNRSTSTSLSMGIRSLFGLGNKGGNDDENENREDIKAALQAIKADLEAVERKEQEEKKLKRRSMSKIKTTIPKPTVNTINAKINTQSVEEPKPRVKKSLANIKQVDVPTPSSRQSSRSSSSRHETVRDRVKRVKSGAMTEDEKLAFLTTALTPRTPQSQKGPRIRQAIPEVNGGTMRASRSKPTKSAPFKSDPLWNTIIGNQKSKDKGDLIGNDSKKQQYLDMVTDPNRFSSYAAMGGYKSEDEDESSGGVLNNMSSVLTKDEQEEEDSLAQRLQAAAILKENKDAEVKTQKDLELKVERERLIEAQRQAAEQIRRREEEKLQQKKETELRLMKEEQERKEAEDNRQKTMLAAQEEYWASKVTKVTEPSQRVMTDEDKQRNLEQITRATNSDAVNKIRSQQRNESDILKQSAEDDLHERERNAKILADSVARTTHTVSQPVVDDVSPGAFVRTQEERKAGLDNLLEEQKARLASLNSPLPSSTDSPIPSMSPQAPVSTPSRSTMPGLSLSELTMNSNKKAASPFPSPTPAPSTPSPNLSLREMTMLNNSRKTNVSSPVSKPAPAREGKGPIRQSIPTDDLDDNDDEDDDVDFFEYSRSGDNSGMSIKDIMSSGGASTTDTNSAAKDKAKMWGIDIDKFN